MKCPLCDMKFCSKRKSQYYRHYKTVHLKMREFECDFCNKKFSRGEHKKRHILRNCKLAKQFVEGIEGSSGSGSGAARLAELVNTEPEDGGEGEEPWVSMMQL